MVTCLCLCIVVLIILGCSASDDTIPIAQFGQACSLSQIFTQSDFNTLFPNANGAANTDRLNQYPIFYYKNLLEAAQTFPSFSCTGNEEIRKRELAAFLAQTSQQTSNWWPGEPYHWGYFFSSSRWCTSDFACPEAKFCTKKNTEFPCAPGQKYFGRGPMQIERNEIYGKVSRGLLNDDSLLTDPDLVSRSGKLAFETALWVWMTPQAPNQPSCHDVITDHWIPSLEDIGAGRKPGFGLTSFLIVNGPRECTKPLMVESRIGYFTTYAKYFNIPTGDNLDCANIKPFE